MMRNYGSCSFKPQVGAGVRMIAKPKLVPPRKKGNGTLHHALHVEVHASKSENHLKKFSHKHTKDINSK
jgi:hypothetical protein